MYLVGYKFLLEVHAIESGVPHNQHVMLKHTNGSIILYTYELYTKEPNTPRLTCSHETKDVQDTR